MPTPELLEWRDIGLLDAAAVGELLGHGHHVGCGVCGEDVLNGRELVVDGRVVCRSCAGARCYEPRMPGSD
jgi:formylmethanofuran dehydrogenase subunit E